MYKIQESPAFLTNLRLRLDDNLYVFIIVLVQYLQSVSFNWYNNDLGNDQIRVGLEKSYLFHILADKMTFSNFDNVLFFSK